MTSYTGWKPPSKLESLSQQMWISYQMLGLMQGAGIKGAETDGFPGDSDNKRILLQCRRPGFNFWVGRFPWRREWKPTPVFLPGKFHGQKSLARYSPWCRKELDMNEWLTLTLFFTEAEVGGNTQIWFLLISSVLYAEFLSCTSGPCPEYQ